jgi:hypothetical protein
MEPRIYYKIRYVKHSAVVVSIILLMSAISMMPIKQKAYAISDYDRGYSDGSSTARSTVQNGVYLMTNVASVTVIIIAWDIKWVIGLDGQQPNFRHNSLYHKCSNES